MSGDPVNIDFSNQPLFSWYVVLLAVSGVVLVGLSLVPTGRTGMRIFNALVGIAFLGYGFYLGFVFDGGTYIIFFKAFIVPVLLIANTVKSYAARRSSRAEAAALRAPQVPYPYPQHPQYPRPRQAQAQQAQQPQAAGAPVADVQG
ncbi:hypothetical protein [Streptacidiphilus cavernicola]|uniref:Uncharacterized protein n=1 Tax=Streptacidiphilus cavernicola TaxID=3342716 RepID=A0ABV6VSE1_9ACTN